MKNKLFTYTVVLWVFCLITLGVVSKITSEDIQRQRAELSMDGKENSPENR